MTAHAASARQLAFAETLPPTYTSADVERLRMRLDKLNIGDTAVADIYRLERITDEDGSEWWILLRRGWYHRGRWQGGQIVERVEIRTPRQLAGVQAHFALALCMRGSVTCGIWRDAAGLDGVAAGLLRAA